MIVQLYLPPEYMLNKDFLKEILTEEKALLRLGEVNRINVPLYDELSVIKLWPMLKNDAKIAKYFPSKLAKGRFPDREYFFNIVNTFQSDYLQALIKHANEQRMSVANEAKAIEAIEISDDWWDQLNAVPFISCKSSRTVWRNNLPVEYYQSTKEERSIFSKRVPSRCHNSANDERSICWARLSNLCRRKKNESKKSQRQRLPTLIKFNFRTTKEWPLIIKDFLISLATWKI